MPNGNPQTQRLTKIMNGASLLLIIINSATRHHPKFLSPLALVLFIGAFGLLYWGERHRLDQLYREYESPGPPPRFRYLALTLFTATLVAAIYSLIAFIVAHIAH